jgi:hypothetical protein
MWGVLLMMAMPVQVHLQHHQALVCRNPLMVACNPPRQLLKQKALLHCGTLPEEVGCLHGLPTVLCTQSHSQQQRLTRRQAVTGRAGKGAGRRAAEAAHQHLTPSSLVGGLVRLQLCGDTGCLLPHYSV